MQNTTKNSTAQVYDYAIIGGGLSGIALATALNQITDNLILIDGADFMGGNNRPIQTPNGSINNGIRYLPESPLANKAVAFLESLLLKNLNPATVEESPVTYENGGLKPFMGFGNTPPAFYSEIGYFTQPSYLSTEIPAHDWCSIMLAQFKGILSPRSHVTRILVEDGVATGLIINGQKTILAKNIIYSAGLKSLPVLFAQGSVPTKTLNRLNKNSFWTAVCLDLIHNHQVTESKAVHILNGTTQDDFGPCAGFFSGSQTDENGKTSQVSQWITFVADEDSEDTEIIGHALKKIKRQIKRAYPQALDNLSYVRIFVVPSFSGDGEVKLSANQTLPGVSNLWIASPQAHAQKNLLGALLQAELVASALGCHPLGTQVHVESETEVLANQIEPQTAL